MNNDKRTASMGIRGTDLMCDKERTMDSLTRLAEFLERHYIYCNQFMDMRTYDTCPLLVLPAVFHEFNHKQQYMLNPVRYDYQKMSKAAFPYLHTEEGKHLWDYLFSPSWFYHDKSLKAFLDRVEKVKQDKVGHDWSYFEIINNK